MGWTRFGPIMVAVFSVLVGATASGAAVPAGQVEDGTAEKLFSRETPSGVTVRAHRSEGPPPPQYGNSGVWLPVDVPVGVGGGCAPESWLSVGLSTPGSVGQGFGGLIDLPKGASLAFVSAGSFGAPEGEPTVWAALQLSREVALVRARFLGGEQVEMVPVRGVAVLVSPVEGTAARHVDQTGPIGKVAALDDDGKVVARMRLGPTQSYETGTPEACKSGLDRELPNATGPPPRDEELARSAVIDAYTTLYNQGASSEERMAVLEDGEALAPTYEASVAATPEYTDRVSIRVDEVRFLDDRRAAVRFGLLVDGNDVLTDQVGRAKLDEDRWVVARATFCTLLSYGGFECPTSGKPSSDRTSSGPTGDLPRLLVLNASGIANAENAKANELRGLNYPIAGTGTAPQQTATTVACVSDFEAASQDLVLALGPSTALTSFPTPPPAGSENADCIVTFGR